MDPQHLMSVQEIIQYAFYGLISILFTYAVRVLTTMTKSIEDLNVRIAIVIERSEHHEKILDKHDSRLASLERIE